MRGKKCFRWLNLLGSAKLSWGVQIKARGRKLSKARKCIFSELNFGGNQLPSIAIWQSFQADNCGQNRRQAFVWWPVCLGLQCEVESKYIGCRIVTGCRLIGRRIEWFAILLSWSMKMLKEHSWNRANHSWQMVKIHWIGGLLWRPQSLV